MSDSEISFSSVEDFLTEERKKLDEDRRAVDLILTLLKNDQQVKDTLLLYINLIFILLFTVFPWVNVRHDFSICLTLATR